MKDSSSEREFSGVCWRLEYKFLVAVYKIVRC
jgi:hypothetical protein